MEIRDAGDNCSNQSINMIRRFSTDFVCMSIYCACGRIMDLDRGEMELKLGLGKDLECSSCRNVRIGREIDYLNNLYAGLISEEDSCFSRLLSGDSGRLAGCRHEF